MRIPKAEKQYFFRYILQSLRWQGTKMIFPMRWNGVDFNAEIKTSDLLKQVKFKKR